MGGTPLRYMKCIWLLDAFIKSGDDNTSDLGFSFLLKDTLPCGEEEQDIHPTGDTNAHIHEQ